MVQRKPNANKAKNGSVRFETVFSREEKGGTVFPPADEIEGKRQFGHFVS